VTGFAVVEQLRLDGKTALVTGAGRGLGRSYAMLLAERGASVVVNNRIRPGLESEPPVAELVAEEIRAAGGRAVANTDDISDHAAAGSAVRSALDAFGRLDIVVNNAGVAHSFQFESYPQEQFESLLAIHVRGTWAVSQAAWPELAKTGAGRLINTVSRAAYLGDPQGAAYATAKGATHGLTRALAVEGAAVGVKVNAICPAAWTPLYDRAATDVSQEQRAALQERFKTEFVAPVIVALAHDLCPCTGEVITAMGGHVNRYFVAQTAGVRVGEDFTPEQFLELLPGIWDEQGYSTIGLAMPGRRGGETPVAEVPVAARRRRPAAMSHQTQEVAQ
jgi:NAD(P)-dependent dehydrogenase (short-subunit alcohol dehydrogenase family)